MARKQPVLWQAVLLFTFCLSLTGRCETPSSSFGYVVKNRVHFVSLAEMASFYSLKIAKTPDHTIVRSGKFSARFTPGSSYFLLNGEDHYMRKRCFVTRNNLYCTVGSWIDLLPLLIPSVGRDMIRVSPRIETIVIDPGHGGKDNGASGHGIKEKNLNLKLARLLMEYLNRQGFRTRMTRYSDIYLRLGERVRMADQLGADLLISLHANSSKYKRARGVEIFRLGSLERHANYKKTLDHLPREKYFVNYLKQNYENATEKLSSQLLKQFKVFKGYPSRGVKKGDFRLLKYSNCPTLIIEVGFVSNNQDAAILKQRVNLVKLANSLSEGISLYCQKKHFLKDL